MDMFHDDAVLQTCVPPSSFLTVLRSKTRSALRAIRKELRGDLDRQTCPSSFTGFGGESRFERLGTDVVFDDIKALHLTLT